MSLHRLAVCVLLVGCDPAEVSDKDDSDSDLSQDSEPFETDTDAGTDTDTLDLFDYAAPPELVTFEPGTFTMGSPGDEVGHTDVEGQHQVTITYRFAIGATEVMQGQFAAHAPADPSYWSGCRRCPVESVSWHAAVAYVNALSEAEGLQACYQCIEQEGSVSCRGVVAPPDCTGYRLPTEAEWEYAARAGGTVTASTPGGGDLASAAEADTCSEPQPLDAGPALGEQAWFCGNSDATPGNTTRAVGQLLDNGAGLFDVLGNVWEWTQDGWVEDLVDATDPVGDPESEHRAVRGGGWNSAPRHVRLGQRTLASPSAANDNLGFRVARTLPPG